MSNYISPDTKETVIKAIKDDGLTVLEAAQHYEVSTKSIYRWLGEQSDGSGSSITAINRLKKENKQLKEIIGKLLLDQEKSKKNT